MADFEVIIVGARVAGASLAIRLGQMGRSVLVLEKASFPSDTLSTHQLSHQHYLEALGVKEKVKELGLREITRMRTYIGRSFTDGEREGTTVIPGRASFDALLMEKATSYECVSFQEEAQVRRLVYEGDAVTGVETVDKKGKLSVYTAGLVVGADGRHSTVAKEANARMYDYEPAERPVFYGYYKGMTPLPEPTVEIFLDEGRIGFVFPMQEGLDCLGLEIHSHEFKSFAKNPQESFEKVFRQMYGMEARMEGAVLEGKVVGTPGVPNFFRQPYGKGWALIGDAAHAKDPSTGLGMNDAIWQALLLAEVIQKTTHGASFEEEMEAYHKERDEVLKPSYDFTLDYIRSLRSWTEDELEAFRKWASNPLLVKKQVPVFADMFRERKEQETDG
ncbi:NAD(P)/FAD-dependent oxidoreductase [Salimicrobium flavidum]|uniref:Dehydrogenase (Flavoprotein) n=1 Tax=Salimicrobium flavidum TaxID=570947 RepID=A0A1N7IUD7_9BACI|nr:NAD(P)/FAD-dependent oxidoreductase [Salimicrobium flavidum]SIS40650.1 Dehydrogenase (flavoprotein) [Salimicrobium flavidum]